MKNLRKSEPEKDIIIGFAKMARNFISRAYDSYAEAGAAADRHVKKYPAHAGKVSVFYCEDGSCK